MFAMDKKPCFFVFLLSFLFCYVLSVDLRLHFSDIISFYFFFLPLTCYLPTTSIVPVILVRLPLLLTTVRHVRKGCHTRLNTMCVKKHHLVDVFEMYGVQDQFVSLTPSRLGSLLQTRD